jgi:hypothetical protein
MKLQDYMAPMVFSFFPQPGGKRRRNLERGLEETEPLSNNN